MGYFARKELQIYVTENTDSATIYLNGHFSVDAHCSFHDAYARLLRKPTIRGIAIDLAKVSYLDSSALGMLLVLLDRAQASNKSLTLSSPSLMAAKVFDIANFDKMFCIQ